jgi:arylsulfatase A-like enzyme
MGGTCEIATSAPGYTSVLPKNKAPLAMTLKLNGYSTAQFGKCHEAPVWPRRLRFETCRIRRDLKTDNPASASARSRRPQTSRRQKWEVVGVGGIDAEGLPPQDCCT